jgi:two-component system LytT family sensor kinase
MAMNPLSARRFLIIFSVAWLVLMTGHALLLDWFDLPLQTAVADSLISNLLLLGVCLIVINTLRFYSPSSGQYLNVVVLCLVLGIFWLLLDRSILWWTLGSEDEYFSFLQRSLIIRAAFGMLILGFVSLICIVWNNFQDQQINEERKADAEKLAKDAELFKLRQQLQPHFLFNSLNSINALIGLRPDEARKMVQQLSDFLRGTLKKDETQWVSLQEELQYLELYLDIEKVRFGNRLSTEVTCEEGTGSLVLPALLLQPVMENAIKFGLYDTIGETVITLHAAVDGENLKIQVENPYDPETSSPKQGTGFGLSSVQRRLYLLFGRNDLLETSGEENIFTTIIRIPQPGDPTDKKIPAPTLSNKLCIK